MRNVGNRQCTSSEQNFVDRIKIGLPEIFRMFTAKNFISFQIVYEYSSIVEIPEIFITNNHH